MNTHRPSRLVGVVALATVATFAAGCGDDAGSDTSISPSLLGQTYVTEQITVSGKPQALPPGVRIEITFGPENKLGVRAGCNQMNGTFSIDDTTLVVSDLAQTEMACEPDRMALDTTVSTLLGGRPTIDMTGETVNITSAATALTLVDIESVDPAPPLAGTVWTLDTLIDGDVASSVPNGLPKPITLVLNANGQFSINTGCNGVGGTYTRTDETLRTTVGPSTLIACPGPEGSLEGRLSTAFATGSLDMHLVRKRLTLTTAKGVGFGFSAAS
jgi:heat shock protein HslJ